MSYPIPRLRCVAVAAAAAPADLAPGRYGYLAEFANAAGATQSKSMKVTVK